MFLSPAEVEELTDLVQSAAQIRWLRNNGWPVEVGATGRPKVLRAEAERRMLTHSRDSRRGPEGPTKLPDLSALR